MEVKREKGFHDYYKIFTENQNGLFYDSYKMTLKHLEIGLTICIHENMKTTLPILLNKNYKI